MTLPNGLEYIPPPAPVGAVRAVGEHREIDVSTSDTREGSGYTALWLWFGLSRAGWLTMPRVMMHAMPDDWQRRMAELCNEWDAAWPNQPDLYPHVTLKNGGKFVKGPGWLTNYRYPDKEALNEMRARKERP